MTPGERIAAYRAAYQAANGKDIEVTFDRGWFRVGGRAASKWRGKFLDECAAVLRMRAAQAGEAGTAETAQTGSVHEHAVAESDAPKGATR